MMNFIKKCLPAFIVGCLFQGCETYKNVPYFSDISDSARLQIANSSFKQLKIQADDILSISIQTNDPNINIISNQGGSNSNPSANGNSAGSLLMSNTSGLLVDKNGEIEVPVIGKLFVAGLTTSEAMDTLRKKASSYFINPTVSIRFANYKITVLGEVAHPGTYVLPNEKATIFDALGLAGDLTIFGKRDNLLLIRDSANHSSLIRFSLNSKNLITQDFFYLKQNDVIYVEPSKAKIESLDAVKTRNYTIGASLLSVLIIIATRIK